MSLALIHLSDNLIELRGLTDTLTGDAVTDADVEVTLTVLKTGEQVEGETWPLTMAHVSGGLYRATLSDALEVRKGQALIATVTASKASTQRTWREVVWVREIE